MSTPRIVTFRMAPEKVAALDSIAKTMDRDRSYLLNEAVENFLSEQQRFTAMVEEGLEAARKGEMIDDQDVGVMIDSWVRNRTRNKTAKADAARAKA
jgi:predicted transcriptional regulator